MQESRSDPLRIPPGHAWNRIPVIAAVVALLGGVTCAILGAANPKQFFFSWLVSFLFFLSLALGALFFVLIQYAAQGGWGIVLRRIGETVFATLPVMAALSLPVFLGVHDLYEWAHAGAAEHDALLQWKAPFLNVPFFLIRAAIYFVIWSFIAVLYYRGSSGQDVTGDPAVSARLRRLAGPSLIVLALTQTFASIDWIMSLTPHWYSTMFGVYFFAGAFVGFIALLSVVSVAMRHAGLLNTVINAEHLHDVGKFLFAFTAFWAYIAFSQFFLMWYANLPEETIWYKARMTGSWMTVSLVLMAGHFVAPFFYLMGRSVKRNGVTLALGGAWLLAMHFLDLYWQVMPTLHPQGVSPSILDVAALVTVGGCFVAAASWLMRREALIPLRDPRLAESLAFENV
ncbi:MAG: quinol:cytochrome C oxidoreductase [Acidobacteria bacterium]|nr:quinol:cytochrome C oxidoreductase [Acidobacteriota bacterium]